MWRCEPKDVEHRLEDVLNTTDVSPLWRVADRRTNKPLMDDLLEASLDCAFFWTAEFLNLQDLAQYIQEEMYHFVLGPDMMERVRRNPGIQLFSFQLRSNLDPFPSFQL